MSERTEYPVGVPCWVDVLRPDPRSAAAFYAELLGWEIADRIAPDATAGYHVGRLRGRDVAAIGTSPAADISPNWNTYVRVDDIDIATATATAGGGRVVVPSLPTDDGGRRALLADPSGATFGVSQPGERQGAQLVNEPSAWSMSILNTRDVDAAKDFYGALFGWTTSSFDAGGFEVTMWHRSGYFGGEPSQPVPRDVVAAMAPLADDGTPARWDVNFWVHDADATAAKTAALGGTVIAAPSDRPPFREAVIADPAGATIAVSQLLTSA